MDPASINVLPVKRLGGKGHIASAGETRSSAVNDNEKLCFRRPVRRECIVVQ